MNKLFKSLIFLFLAMALVFGLCACTEEPAQQQPQEHVHTFSSEWSTDANYHWHAATCEHTEQKADRAKHTWSYKVTTEATHTSAGERIATCTGCGLTKTEVIPAKTLVHTFSDEWTHDETYHWHVATCEHTGEKGSFEPHTWDSSEIITPSTCTEAGTIRYTCKCGATKDEALPLHSFSAEWSKNETYHWHAATCEHTDQVSDKAEHDWNSGVTKTPGTVTYTCNVCGQQKVVNASSDFSTGVRMITAGPGEDSSTQAVISWHSASTGSSLEYALADSDIWTTVANAQCNETLSTADWRDTAGKALTDKHYRCKVYLDNLIPDSDYKYRIKYAGSSYSDIASFKTAEADTTYFQFLWMSDLHTPKGGDTYTNRVAELVDFAESKEGVDLDFVLFTGDMVNKGQIYKHWNYWSDSGLLNDYTYAFVCGNHDYYGWNDKERTINDFYKEICAYPANNTEGTAFVLDSNYWFIWNRVLFVCIDNFTQESAVLQNLDGASLAAQQAWFKAVVDANEGNYDYLIFAQHLPFFNTDTKPCDYGNYTAWRKIFDEYKVDFALSSDEHHYRRTYPLYNNQKQDYVDGKVQTGTVYVTSNQTEGSSLSSLRNEASEGLKYIEYSAGGQGGVYFTVTPNEMTLHQIGTNGNEYDTVTVLKKDRSK